MEGQETDSIDFMAKYREWVAIKKMSIAGSTKPEEVVAHLAVIRQTAGKKAYEYVGIDTQALDAYADSVTKGVRKSYSTLAELISRLGEKEAKETAAKAARDEKLAKIATAYLMKRIANALGYDTEINLEMMESAFPDLKIKKPPGRRKK